MLADEPTVSAALRRCRRGDEKGRSISGGRANIYVLYIVIAGWEKRARKTIA